MNKIITALALMLLLVLVVTVSGQDAARPHHRNAVVLTWNEAAGEWSPLPDEIIPGSVQVFRNGLALADQIDSEYNMSTHVFTLHVSRPDDVILVTYDAY